MIQILLIATYFSLIISYSFNKGWFSVGGLGLLFTALALLLIIFFNKAARKNFSQKSLELILAFGLFFSIALANSLWDYDMNAFVSFAMLVVRILLLLALSLSLFYIIEEKLQPKLLSKTKFVLLLIIAFTTRLLMLKIVILPQVDIFFNLKYRSMEIIHLRNPYSLSYNYPPDIPASPKHYPYGPLSLLLLVPFNLLGDPRLLIFFSDFVTAYVFYKLLAKKRTVQELIPLLFLYHPQALFYASLSAIDNVIVALLALFFYWYKKKKYLPAFLALSFVGGIKHAYMLVYIFMLKFIKRGKSLVSFLLAGIFLTSAYGIFVLWDFPALYHNLFSVFASFTKSWIVPASLSIQALLIKQTTITPFLAFQPSILLDIVPTILVTLLLFLFLPKSLLKLSLAMAISLLVFFLFAPYALFQYYFVISSLTLISFCLAKPPPAKRQPD